MMKIAVFVALIAVSTAVPTSLVSHVSHSYPGMTAAFDSWMTQHEKTYETEEEQLKRFNIFTQNAIRIEEHNSQNHTWTMTLNQFADLTSDEFAALQTLQMGTIGTEQSSAPQRHVRMSDSNPDSVDWRTQGLVSDIKNQGQCGSCWAFSTVVSLEGQGAKKAGKMTTYSEQDLVDCVKDVTVSGQKCCDGCQGGLMDYAFKYMIDSQNGMDDTETSYPYKGADGTCSFSGSSAGPAVVKNYTDITAGDEDGLLDATANVGPISIAVDANMFWQFYGGGVFSPLFCNQKSLNHGVAVVGYGTDGDKDYWIIRNSWGTTWGEKGYMRIVRGKNECGLANSAVYPTM
jgi:C1A family cysteine protease